MSFGWAVAAPAPYWLEDVPQRSAWACAVRASYASCTCWNAACSRPATCQMDLRRRRKQRAADRLTHGAASRVRVRAFARLAEGLLQRVGVGAGSHTERSAVEAQRLLLLLRGHRCFQRVKSYGGPRG